MKRQTLLTALAAGAVVAIAALVCRAPGVLYADAGELLVAAARGGVAHPPGFPIYLLLGGLWLDGARLLGLPLASSLNAFSAVCDGLAAAGIAAAALALLARCEVEIDEKMRPGLGFAAGLLAGTGPTLFDFSLGIEVYALQAAILAAAMWLCLEAGGAGDKARRRRLTLLAGVAVGAGLAGHHATMVVSMPGLAVLLWGAEPGRDRLRRAGLFAAGLVPGLALYALLPLRASRHPVLNWGDPSNLRRFLSHVTAEIYQVNIESTGSVIAEHARRFLGSYQDELSLLGLLSALGAAALFLRRGRGAVPGLLLLIAGDVAFAVRYEIAEDQAAYYIPTFLATSLLAVLGAAGLGRLVKRQAAVVGAAVLGVLALATDHLIARGPRRHDARAVETGANLLESVPKDGLCLTPEWNAYAPAMAAQETAGARPDLLLLDILLLRRGWYLDTFAARHPQRATEVRAELTAYREQLREYEEKRPYDADQLTRLYNGFVQSLATAAWQRGAEVVWAGAVMTDLLPTGAALIPAGIGYRVLPSRARTALYVPQPPVAFTFATRADLPEDYVYSGKIRPLYSGMLIQRSLYEQAFQRPAEARAAVELARVLDPAGAEPMETLADLLAREGKLPEALGLYTSALQAGGDADRLAEKSRTVTQRLNPGSAGRPRGSPPGQP